MPFDTDTNIHIGRVHLRRAERSGANKEHQPHRTCYKNITQLLIFVAIFFLHGFCFFGPIRNAISRIQFPRKNYISDKRIGSEKQIQ